jgi:hypothetical protein
MFIGAFIIFIGAPIMSMGFIPPSAFAIGNWAAQAMPIAARAAAIGLVFVDMVFLLQWLLYFVYPVMGQTYPAPQQEERTSPETEARFTPSPAG